MTQLNRIGFFIHTDEMFNHYQPVWKLLAENAFTIVLYGDEAMMQRCQSWADERGYFCVNYLDVIAMNFRFEVFVSNHAMMEYQGKLLNLVLGKKQVRFMYALGKAKHNYSSWNNTYDLILCFGPLQVEQLQACCKAICFQMGYPRYDDYFNSPELVGLQPPELGLDPLKPTILWLPTWLELSSLSHYADVMASLCDKYNVIVKTHPLTREQEPENLAILSQYQFTSVITEVYDNLNLFRCADYVVCDYGGTAFGAIYLDKPLLLLNLPNAKGNHLVGDDSPDISLREQIVNLDIAERWQLPSILLDTLLWQRQVEIRQQLRRRYFCPSYGYSSYLAALALVNIDSMLQQG